MMTTDSRTPTSDNAPIKSLQRDVDQWIADFGVRYFNELTNMAQLSEEVGEVARISQRSPPMQRRTLVRNSLMFSLSCFVWPIKQALTFKQPSIAA
jgi:hypothetical protein